MQNAIVFDVMPPTFEDFKKFNHFHFSQKRWRIPVMLIGGASVLLLWVFYALGYDEYFSFTLALTIVYALYFGLFRFMLDIRLKRHFHSAQSRCKSSTRYEFRSETIVASQESEEISGHSERQYQTLYKVYETKNAFYLYTTLNQALLIPKSNIGQATEQLSALLQNKLGDKFVKRA